MPGCSRRRAGVIGLSNVVALEAAAQGVRCNVIVPAAMTRMAMGSTPPPIRRWSRNRCAGGGWLAHEACSISGGPELRFPVVPSDHRDHIGYSFAMARPLDRADGG